MGEIGIIAVGLVCLFLIVMVRQFMSLRLPEYRWRVAPVNEAPNAYRDLFAQDERELVALGFDPLGWVFLEDAGGDHVPAVARVLACRSSGTVAMLQPPVGPEHPNELLISLATEFVDGSALTSLRNSPADEFFSAPPFMRRSHAVDTLALLVDAHRNACAEHGVEPVRERRDIARWVTYCNGMFPRFQEQLIAHGKVYRDTRGGLRLRPAALAGLFGLLLRRSRPPYAGEVPVARQVALLALHERLRRRMPTRGARATLLVVTTLLFILLGALLWNAVIVIWLAVALIVHEGGHYLAMRLFGYRDVQMVLLPLLGGVTTASEPSSSGCRHALVSLAGPLPGIVLGWVLLAVAGFDPVSYNAINGHLLVAALVFLGLNYLNLLPVPPLDGGHLVQALLPRGTETLGVIVTAVMLLLGLWIAWMTGWWLLLLLVVWQALQLPRAWREVSMLRECRETGSGRVRDAQLLALCAKEAPNVPLQKRFEQVIALRERLDLTPPRALSRMLLLLLYLAPFALPLLHPEVRFFAGLFLP